MQMTILERGDGITHVVLSGRLDTNAAEQIDQQFSAVIAAGNCPAIVDLSQIDFMASRGIGLLVANGKRLLKAGHKLVLLKPEGMVAGVLKTAKADLLMPIAHDIEEAIGVLGGGRSAGGAPDAGAAKRESPAEPRKTVSTAVPAPDALKWSIKNETSELDALNAAVAQFLTAHATPPRAAYAVNLALEELIVNVIQYAYIDDEAHTIDVELGVEGPQIVLRIVDDGMPFDPRKGPALHVDSEDRVAAGLGLTLVLDMVDVLKYRREQDKNRVEVRIRLAAQEDDD